jgi:hypothetical protein
MKSFKLFALALVIFGASFITSSNPAFALQCKDGGSQNADECWTDVQVSISETTPVIPGAILKYDVATDSAEENAFEVRVASASADYGRVAGVAQSRIATGDWGRVLVRGPGKIRKVIGGVQVTGDYLFVAVSNDAGSVQATGASPIAFTRQATTAAGATVDAYIVVI